MGLNQSAYAAFHTYKDASMGLHACVNNVEMWRYNDRTLKLVKIYDKHYTNQSKVLHCTTGPAVIEYNEDGQISSCLYFLNGEEQFDVDPHTFGKHSSWDYLNKLCDVDVDITQVASYLVLGIAAISVSTQIMKK